MNLLRMSGRGQERDPGGRRKWVGRGRGTAPPASDVLKSETKGSNPDLPYLNYGAAPKENRPIEFLQLIGEYYAINLKAPIAQAFWTSTPVYGVDEIELLRNNTPCDIECDFLREISECSLTFREKGDAR